uniref:Uncharacterized protein MANES_11G025600 n=1 Tax=Rhizophora mucronata TaxID=61149 RepID=A0A2P2M5J1_RHIMU
MTLNKKKSSLMVQIIIIWNLDFLQGFSSSSQVEFELELVQQNIAEDSWCCQFHFCFLKNHLLHQKLKSNWTCFPLVAADETSSLLSSSPRKSLLQILSLHHGYSS